MVQEKWQHWQAKDPIQSPPLPPLWQCLHHPYPPPLLSHLAMQLHLQQQTHILIGVKFLILHIKKKYIKNQTQKPPNKETGCLKLHWPEWVERLEERLVRMTRSSPLSPSKRQIKTAAFLVLWALILCGSCWAIGVVDSAKPTWETTFPTFSSRICSSKSPMVGVAL